MYAVIVCPGVPACSGRGSCSDGVSGNGTCTCQVRAEWRLTVAKYSTSGGGGTSFLGSPSCPSRGWGGGQKRERDLTKEAGWGSCRRQREDSLMLWVPGQGTLLSYCLSPPESGNGYQQSYFTYRYGYQNKTDKPSDSFYTNRADLTSTI